MIVTRAPSVTDYPFTEFAVLGRVSAAAPITIIFHVRARNAGEATTLAQNRPSADGLALEAKAMRSLMAGPAGVRYEGPWPW